MSKIDLYKGDCLTVMDELIESPINYMGSKYKLLSRLIPLFPYAENFVDLFAGGGSVYINIAKRYKKVIANEYINGVYQIHKNIFNKDFIMFASEYSIATKTSKDAYLRLRDEYNNDKSPVKLLALIWSCNSNMMRFNNTLEFNQTWGKRCFNKNTENKLSKLHQLNVSNVSFTNLSFEDVVLPNNCFVYIDPPYSNTEAGYNAIWNKEYCLIEYLKYLIDANIPFGISGVHNGKENKVYDFLKTQNLTEYQFEDLYKKISKKDKTNIEYYITNATKKSIEDTVVEKSNTFKI